MKFGCRFVAELSWLLLLLSLPARVTPAATESSREISDRNVLLAGEPIIEIAPDGWVNVKVETTQPCIGGNAFLGIFPIAPELKYPAYRVTGKLVVETPNRISAQFNLARLEDEEIDVNNLQGNGGGHVALRIVLFSSREYFMDRSFAYRRTQNGLYRRTTALVEGPFVDCVTDTSAVISWELDQPSVCQLLLDPGGKIIGNPKKADRFEVPISDLSPNASYSYRVSWSDEYGSYSTPTYGFHTAPSVGSDAPFRFAVFCDGRNSIGGSETNVEGVNRAVFIPLLNQAYVQGAEFIVFPGDLVSGSTTAPEELERQFRSWKRITAPVGCRIPIYEGIGNHDLTRHYIGEASGNDYFTPRGQDAGEVIFAKHFVNPENGPDPADPDYPPYRENVYSFDWGNSHFTVLNSNYFEKGSGANVANQPGQLQGAFRDEQLEWLENDLRSARQKGRKHLFVFSHEPAFPNGGHVKDAMWWKGEKPEMIEIRNRFWKTLCRYHVLAVFHGDEHNYSRTLIDSRIDPSFDIPIWQIITGGGGAPFYARDLNVPWAEAVQAFYPLPHICVVEVDGKQVKLDVITLEGLLIESVSLSAN